MTTMTLDITALRALIAAATPGPWAYRMGDVVQLTDAGKGYPLDYYPNSVDVIARDRDGDLSISDADAEFIAATRTALPAALDAMEALRVCVIYARDRRGAGFDFDTWIHLVEAALTSGTLPPHAIEEAQAEALQYHTALANVREERDRLRALLAEACALYFTTPEQRAAGFDPEARVTAIRNEGGIHP
jgi:hypothetical protein